MGVGPSCGSENQISEVDAGIEVIDGYHDVPAADVVDNDLIRDVVGNKTDARSEAVGIVSLVALLRETLAEVVEIEHHLHNRERWFGISGDQSGTELGCRYFDSVYCHQWKQHLWSRCRR